MRAVQHIGVWVIIFSILSLAPVTQASPQDSGYVPNGVGKFDAARHYCDTVAPPWLVLLLARINWLIGGGAELANLSCHSRLDGLEKIYKEAYLEAETIDASPGYPVNDIHFWGIAAIQDFTGGKWGDGAIMMLGQNASIRPKYLGRWIWEAFKRSDREYHIFPGYPINVQHQWNRVSIQDFRDGSWGDAAIILDPSRQRAELVAGRHWQAYIKADGSNRLLSPRSFVYREGPWYVQDFEGGKIYEQGGDLWVLHYDTGQRSHIVL